MSRPFICTDVWRLLPRLVVAASFVLFAASAGLEAGAADMFDRLMSPGELSKAHENVRQSCRSCHVAFDKKAQTKLCRDCHKPIATQILRKSGFHGRNPQVRKADCKQCHSEHKGRNAAITAFDRDTFNHQFTDYPLKGKHAKVACASCHKAGAKYAAAPVTCFDCHRSNDQHRGRLGTNCASCHNEAGWKGVKFDHAAYFPLTGKHAQATCESCHPDERYKKTPKDCFSCHQLDDTHKGLNGPTCDNCHTTSTWTKVFDHNRKTRFPLSGRHASISCKSCHAGEGKPRKVPMTCIGCHKEDDVHRGGNGPSCQTCHSARGWKQTTFDHNAKTDFPLRGAHTRAACKDCHKSGVFTQKIATTCISCHRKNDVHQGQQGVSCGKCHNEKAWDAKVKFDHGLTRFPLVGLHATTACEECHVTAKFQDASNQCGVCHAKNDKHKGTLGPRCGDCHNPNGWALWKFDHDRQTQFPLTGQHADLVCSACHKTEKSDSARASKSCISCHRADDIHRGDFGERCEACHTTESFAASRKRR
jgi:hypothetical protein